MKNLKIPACVIRGLKNGIDGASSGMPYARILRTHLPAMVCACWPDWAGAHAWNIPYFLPVPLWLYAYASTGALILSFAILSMTGLRPSFTGLRMRKRRWTLRIPAVFFLGIQWASTVFLIFLIFAGIEGTQNPFQNISMAGFWLYFYLGSLYISGVLGDIYALVNPFAPVLRVVARYCPSIDNGWFSYPRRAGYYPALAGYIALIALELFGSGIPKDVSLFLIVYVLYALIGSVCFGRNAWHKYFDTFGVLCRLCSLLSPFAWIAVSDRTVRIRLRNPLAAIASSGSRHLSVVVFLSFMLSSTAYDGLRDTAPWSAFFWRLVYPHIVGYLPSLAKDYALSASLFGGWQWVMFAVVGAAYYLVFMGFCWFSTAVSRTSLDGVSFAQQFCLTLLPIAFFYNVCHYFTLFLNQGRQTLLLVADPLGLGWNLVQVPLAAYPGTQPPTNMSFVWHAQVLFILFGHVLSVYIAHAIAAQNRDLARAVVVNQLPLLVLTIGLTVSGLWILSLPLA